MGTAREGISNLELLRMLLQVFPYFLQLYSTYTKYRSHGLSQSICFPAEAKLSTRSCYDVRISCTIHKGFRRHNFQPSFISTNNPFHFVTIHNDVGYERMQQEIHLGFL